MLRSVQVADAVAHPTLAVTVSSAVIAFAHLTALMINYCHSCQDLSSTDHHLGINLHHRLNHFIKLILHLTFLHLPKRIRPNLQLL